MKRWGWWAAGTAALVVVVVIVVFYWWGTNITMHSGLVGPLLPS